jgi:hypothetical protein
MGNQVSLVPKVSYEDIQMIVYRNVHAPNSTLLINTLQPSLQHCLIKTTVDIRFEEKVINSCIMMNPNVMIIVYGKNSTDITILHKYEQLVKLGFTNVHIYTGGIFEWMLLHEIYGKDLFKITQYEIDILRYRPKSVLLAAMTGGGGGGGGTGGAGEDFGGYIEDDTTKSSHHHPDDCRIHIPEQDDGGNGGGGGIFSSSIKWLFGS